MQEICAEFKKQIGSIICRELLGLDKDVTIVNDSEKPETYKVKELIPKTFTEENL